MAMRLRDGLVMCRVGDHIVELIGKVCFTRPGYRSPQLMNAPWDMLKDPIVELKHRLLV